MLRVYLFGALQVTLNQRAIKLRDATSRALFAYLATRPQKSASRPELVREFWGDLPDPVARRKLSWYLSALRSALGNTLTSDRQTVSFRSPQRCWVDAEEFQKLVAHAEKLSHGAESARCFQEALTLYRRGDLLAGHDDEWVLYQREHSKEFYISALKHLVEHHRERKEWTTAITYALEWAQTAPLSEEAHRELILLHWANRDLHAALHASEAYTRLCEQEGVKPSHSVLDLHHELFRLVEAHSEGTSDAYKSRFLFDILMAYAKQYEHEGRRREQEIVLEEAFQIAHTLKDDALRAAVQNKRSVLFWRISRYKRAREAAAEALKLYKRLGDKKGEIESRVYLGYCKYYQGRFAEALRIFQQAHRVARQLGDKTTLSRTHNSLGMAYMGLNKPDRAVEHFEHSLALRDGTADEREVAGSLSNLAAAYHTLGELGRALECYQRALQLEERAGHRWGVAANLVNIAALYDDVGGYHQARAGYEQAVEIFHELKDMHAEVSTLINLVTTLYHLEEYPQALELGERALALAREIGDHEGEAGLLLDRGNCYLQLKEYDRAKTHFTEALTLSCAHALKGLEARAHSCLADLHLACGKPYQAFQASQRALQALGDSELIESETIWFTRFQAAQAVGRENIACEALRNAYEIVQRKARAIRDERLRRSFLHNVQINREITREALLSSSPLSGACAPAR